MTYVVLVLLILLWAAVLLPPYLKERKSTRSFRPSAGLGGSVQTLGERGAAAPMAGGRFLPMEQMPANVVQLRPETETATTIGADGIAVIDDLVHEPQYDDVWSEASHRLGAPRTTAEARERRRQVLIGLTGLAFVTLLGALAFGGVLTTIHVAIDAVVVAYVILLVRHRQLADAQAARSAPIRPPLTEVGPMVLQPAPAYLLRSGTGS